MAAKRDSREIILAKFQTLFFAARAESRNAGKEASSDATSYSETLSFARTNHIVGAEDLLQASLLEWQGQIPEAFASIDAYRKTSGVELEGLYWFLYGTINGKAGDYDSAIQAYQNVLAMSDFARPGDAWVGLGNAYFDKGNYDTAIQSYRNALDTPNYDMTEEVWRNIGIAYSEKGDHNSAIDAYQKALVTPNYVRAGDVWNDLGIAYYNKGDYNSAIDAYQKALATPNYDRPGYAWNNLGNAQSDKGDYDTAIQSYRNALATPNYDMIGSAWFNLGITYRDHNDFLNAKEAFEQALAVPDADGYTHAQVRNLLSLLSSELTSEELSRDDRAMFDRQKTDASKDDTAEKRILAKIQDAEESQYERYLQKPNSDRNDVLSILRGWSSAVTLLEGSERLWRGGGYFLKWQGKGIVIDPGFDFLRNLHDEGYHGREISAVIVSHNHPDHNSDLLSLDDLRYELYKRRKSDIHGGVDPYFLVWDESTKANVSFSSEKPAHQFTPVQFDLGRCEPTDELVRKHGLPFTVTYFKVNHGGLRGAVGFKLILHNDSGADFVLGYTGDTEYFAELPQLLSGCDILLAHISQPDIEEFTDDKAQKKIHLGYRGLAKLVREAKPKLTLVGEFWAGLADLRIDLVAGLRSLSNNANILPTGIGMHINIPDMTIVCSQCGKTTSYTAVKVAPPASRYANLSYLCSSCLLT